MIKKPLIIPFLITLIFSTFSPITIHSANAATVGTAPCDSTVSSATGVTATTSGDYCVVSFTDTTTAVTWTVPTGVSSVRTLVVGGGGGGGGGGCNWMYPRGGGGGNVVDSATTAVTAGASVNIIVGAGGVEGVSNGCNGPASLLSAGTQGGSSQFGTNSAVSGGYSSPLTTSAGGTSGSGYAGSGANNLATAMSSYAGGGGGGAAGRARRVAHHGDQPCLTTAPQTRPRNASSSTKGAPTAINKRKRMNATVLPDIDSAASAPADVTSSFNSVAVSEVSAVIATSAAQARATSA